MTHTSFPKQEFLETQRLNPKWSSFTCFAETIKGRLGLHKKTIRRYFNKLVDVDDYAKKGREEIMSFLFGLTQIKGSSPRLEK